MRIGDQITSTCQQVENHPFINLDGVVAGAQITLEQDTTEGIEEKPSNVQPNFIPEVENCDQTFALTHTPFILKLRKVDDVPPVDPMWIAVQEADWVSSVAYPPVSSPQGLTFAMKFPLSCRNNPGDIGLDIELSNAPVSVAGVDGNGTHEITDIAGSSIIITDGPQDPDNACLCNQPPFGDVPCGTSYAIGADGLTCHSLIMNDLATYAAPVPYMYTLVRLNLFDGAGSASCSNPLFIRYTYTNQSYAEWLAAYSDPGTVHDMTGIIPATEFFPDVTTLNTLGPLIHTPTYISPT